MIVLCMDNRNIGMGMEQWDCTKIVGVHRARETFCPILSTVVVGCSSDRCKLALSTHTTDAIPDQTWYEHIPWLIKAHMDGLTRAEPTSNGTDAIKSPFNAARDSVAL